MKEKKSIGPWLRSFEMPPVPTEIRKLNYATVKQLHACENHFMKVLGTLRQLNQRLAIGGPGAAKGNEACRRGGREACAIIHREKNAEGKSIVAVRGGLAGGPIGIRRMRELHPELDSKNGTEHGLKFGHIGGRRVEELHPGHYSRMGKNSNDAEHQSDPSYYENKSRAGFMGALAAKEKLSCDPVSKERQRQGAINGSRIAREKHPTLNSDAGVSGCHSRWHVSRGMVNDNCILCCKASLNLPTEIKSEVILLAEEVNNNPTCLS